jgi:hypothetical protein
LFSNQVGLYLDGQAILIVNKYIKSEIKVKLFVNIGYNLEIIGEMALNEKRYLYKI